MRLTALETRIKDQYPLWFPAFKLEISTGKERNIRYTERVHTINDVEDVIEVTVVVENGVLETSWVEKGFADNNFEKWIHKDSFAERKDVSERYGF